MPCLLQELQGSGAVQRRVEELVQGPYSALCVDVFAPCGFVGWALQEDVLDGFGKFPTGACDEALW